MTEQYRRPRRANALNALRERGRFKAADDLASVTERFMRYVLPEPNSGCWLWAGNDDCRGGYGRFFFNGTTRIAHRVAYELFRGPIPPGLQLDHRCRVRCCVNPDHLEPVTRRENMVRGDTFIARQVAQTHCLNGHPLTVGNIYPNKGSERICITCERARAVAGHRRRRAHAQSISKTL
jgi:hypothetical protein